MHHIRFGAGGRKTYIGNVIRLCTACHTKVHSNDKKYRPILIAKINRIEEINED
jgi:5-methylcytosine-specific restriction endonuclease McrA